MRSALLPNTAGPHRLTSYYEFCARQAKRAEVALDIVEFEVIETSTGIEVQEERFDSMDELMAHVNEVLGELR